MAYASKAGRARTSSKKPQAFAVCQRCGIWENRVNLSFQFQWRGAQLQNTYILVCEKCLDIPTEQNRAIILPPDPVPIFYPSVEDFEYAENNYLAASAPLVVDLKTGLPIPSTTLFITEDSQNQTVDPFGVPVGFNQDAVMPFNAAVIKPYGVPLQVLSVISNGSATVQVNCSAPHGLANVGLNSQVSIQGLAAPAACGFYSVTVVSATVFTYMCYGSIPAQSLLTPTTNIITALVGLPRGYAQIPKIEGPPLTGVNQLVCYLETEDGTGMFLLEDGSGNIQLETCNQPPVVGTYFFELESGAGVLLTENGGFFELEAGP
jgi:hypothetical protein